MNKTAVVTGASRGIGRETALSLAKRDHQVVAIARTEAKLHELQERYPDHIHGLPMDLSDKRSFEELENKMSETFSGVDIIINNAGRLINKPFSELTESDWQTMLEVNLMTSVRVTKTLLAQMNEKSHIVNISSMGGFMGSQKFPGLTAYSVAKGAVSILSECLAAEFTEQDIRVNALCLGSVETEMFRQAFPGMTAAVKPKKMGNYIANFALQGSDMYNGKVLPVALNDPS